MNRRHCLLFVAYGQAFVAVLCLGLVLLGKADAMGVWFGLGFGALMAGLALYNFRNARKVPEDQPLGGPPPNSSLAQQLAFYRRTLVLAVIAFAVLSAWIAMDLNALESGRRESVTLWAPIAFLYRLGGYWLAVLAAPALGAYVCFASARMIRKIQREIAEGRTAESRSIEA